MRPNIILIVFDTARADAFEPYGAKSGSTPVIADLARQGWSAPAAFATSNWTLPSHLSLFTGRVPRAAGLGRSSTPIDVMRANIDRMLPAVLNSSGYQTRAVSANPWVSPVHGFDTGFDVFHLVRQTRRHSPAGGKRALLRWLRSAALAQLDDGLAEIDKTVGAWIDERPSEPFFWFVNLMECHSPYLPPRPYNDFGPIGRLLAGIDSARYQSHQGFLRVCMGDLDVPEKALDRMRHLYARSVRSMDDWLGRLLSRLEAASLLSSTSVIATSDHGENFGEAHLLGHALSLDDRLIRIPLVSGGGIPLERPSTIATLAGIPSMVASTSELRDHPWTEPSVTDGIVVAQNDGVATFGDAAAEALAKAFGANERAVRSLMTASRVCATDGRFKLVRTGGTETLYDVVDDPLESRDVLESHSAQAERLRRVMDAHDLPVVSVSDTQQAPADEVADLEERMRLLGYL